MPTEADLLADLLDGKVDAADVPAEIAELGSLAGEVSRHITLVPPTDAFRASLRDEVLQATGGAGGAASGSAAGGAASTGAGATMTGGSLSAIVAGVAATAVLATSTVAAADRAGPGDLLAGLDRSLESAQLVLADERREAELLVDFAAERVLEAVGLVDTEVVEGLLEQTQDLLDEALGLGLEQGRDLEQLLEPYQAALLTLASRSEDPGVQGQVTQLLDATGLGGGVPGGDQDVSAPVGDAPSDQDGDGAATGSDANDGATDGGEVLPVAPGQAPTEPLDGLEDPVEVATEPLDELDDLTEPLDELDEPLRDTPAQLQDSAGDAVGG